MADAPTDADANRQLGLFLRRERRGEAFDWLARAALIEPGDDETRAALAEYEQRPERAERRLIVALLRGGEPCEPPAPRGWLDYARAGLSPRAPAADDDSGPAAWRRAASLEPGDGRAWVAARLEARPQQEVLAACRLALVHAPRNPALHLFHAQVLSALDRPAAAAQSALAAWRLRPGWEPAAARLADMGWSPAELEAVARDAWGPRLPGDAESGLVAPPALKGRARTIWTHLAAAAGAHRTA